MTNTPATQTPVPSRPLRKAWADRLPHLDAVRKRFDDKTLRRRLRTLGIILGTILLVRIFVVEATVIPTASMERTILIGDHIFLNKFSYGPAIPFTRIRFPTLRKVRRQQVVAFRYPRDPSLLFVKRVIGVPGDRLRIIRKMVTIHDTPLSEPYAYFSQERLLPLRDHFPPRGEQLDRMTQISGVDPSWARELREFIDGRSFLVPAGHYFVMGDNRDGSLDSRFWGLVGEEYIVGEPLFVYWSYDAPTEEWVNRGFVSQIKFDLSILANFFSKTRWSRIGKVI